MSYNIEISDSQISFEFVFSMFWEKSILEKPEGVELVCHASAWDFFVTNDVR